VLQNAFLFSITEYMHVIFVEPTFYTLFD